MMHPYYGYGGGLMAYPAPFGAGGNIAGCNMFGMGGARKQSLKTRVRSSNNFLNTLTRGMTGKARLQAKLNLVQSQGFPADVVNYLTNRYTDGLIGNRCAKGDRVGYTLRGKRPGTRKCYKKKYGPKRKPGRPKGSKNKK